MVIENRMPNPIVSVFFSLFLGYTNLYDIFFAAPCVNICLKNWVKIRASLVLNLTNTISTAGAVYWPIFGGLNCQFRDICSNRELDCFNDFPICQWKSLGSKVTLVPTVRSPIFEGLVVVLRLTEVIHCRVQTVLAAFRWRFQNFALSIFGDSLKLFNIFTLNFPYLRLDMSPFSGAVDHWYGK